MALPISSAVAGTRVVATGTLVITSGFAAIIGVAFYGTGTGGIQFFVGVTASTSISGMITFSATASAVAAGLSPMFFPFPLQCSGTGLTIKSLDSLDTNLTLFWSPQGQP